MQLRSTGRALFAIVRLRALDRLLRALERAVEIRFGEAGGPINDRLGVRLRRLDVRRETLAIRGPLGPEPALTGVGGAAASILVDVVTRACRVRDQAFEL